jgi:hypothetical protein
MEEPFHAERTSLALSPEARAHVKAAVPSSGSANNWQLLNVAPKRMVRSTDLQSHHIKHLLGTDIGRCFQRSREHYRRTASGN